MKPDANALTFAVTDVLAKVINLSLGFASNTGASLDAAYKWTCSLESPATIP